MKKAFFLNKGGTMTWATDMQCFKERFSAIIIVITSMTMMMIIIYRVVL